MIRVRNAHGTSGEQFDIDETEIKSMEQSGPFSSAGTRGHGMHSGISESYTTTITMNDGKKHRVDGSLADIHSLIDAAQREAK